MEFQTFTAPSSDGIHTLAGRVYRPEGTPRGTLHVVHGMTEYIARYDRFMQAMAADGWLTCGYDNLGHGQTVNHPSELGYIAPKNGYDLLGRDVGVFSAAVRRDFDLGDKPYILMGHSMGSFMVRYATEKGYVTPDRLIVMGTGGPNPIAGAGLLLVRLIKLFRGGHHISPLVDKLAFGSYNSHFGGDDPHEWLNSRKEGRDLYRNDPLCTFKFTVSAMGDLISLTTCTNRRRWFSSLPAGMPVLLVSGVEDPVGDYGKGVEKVRDRLTRAGVPVTCHLYGDARHEILNDLCYPAVLADIQAFLAAPTESQKRSTP